MMGRLHLQKLQEAMDRLEEASAQQKRAAGRRRQDITFEAGEAVLLNTKNLAHVPATKLSTPYCGPFVITKVGDNDTYTIDLPSGWGIFPKFHVSRLEKYYTRTSENEPPRRGGITREGDNNASLAIEIHDEEEEQLYIMERITGWKPEGNDIKYRVKWVGYDRQTWEPAKEVLDAQGADLIEEFRKQWNEKFPNNPFENDPGNTAPLSAGGGGM